MMSATPQTTPSATKDDALRDKYVARLRARLSRPAITVEDARDGMLDCYVSTYHAGVEHGLKGILGVDASPDQVAQVASKMFRDRLSQRGVSFEAPSVEALSDIKDELDGEFHFSELPVEVSATHDQVCSLLLAKADGLLEHHGDRSVLAKDDPATSPTETPPSAPVRSAPPPPPVSRPAARPVTTTFNPAAVPNANPAARSGTSVTASLRQALATYLAEVVAAAEHAEPSDLLRRIDRARSLAQSIADFHDVTGGA